MMAYLTRRQKFSNGGDVILPKPNPLSQQERNQKVFNDYVGRMKHYLTGAEMPEWFVKDLIFKKADELGIELKADGGRIGFKYGGSWADWATNYEDQMTFEEYLRDDTIVKKPHFLDRKADGGRIGFNEGTKPVITKDKFIELRIKYKNTHTNAEFAELLNKDWKPSQADSFNQNNVHKRMKDYRNDFPKDFDFKGSKIERAITEKKMIELWGKDKYQEHKKNFSDKKLKDKYTSDKNYQELPIEKKQEKAKKALVLKKKKIEAMDPDAREEFIAKEKEEAAARTRKSRGQTVKFYKNPRNAKSILWGDLVTRTYKNLWDAPFKFSKDSLKLINSKPELNRGDMEKITLIDKNNKPFNWNTIESYVQEGNARNSKGQPMSWDEIIRSQTIKEFINKEGLAQEINKALIPGYDPKTHVKQSGLHIAHNTSFKDGPWETHIAPYKANIQEGAARKIFTNLWKGSDTEFEASDKGEKAKEKRMNLRRKAVKDYYTTMEPITDIQYGLSKKQHGAATPIEKIFKKIGIKLNPGQIKKAQVFLRSALNKGQDISKFIPLPGRGGAAALDYSLFNFVFGVPPATAAVGAAGWLSKNRLPGQMLGTQAHAMGFMDEMNQKKAEIDEQKNLEAAARLSNIQSTAQNITPFELDEKEEVVTANKPTYGPYAEQIKNLKV